jgi:hypothetical protein
MLSISFLKAKGLFGSSGFKTGACQIARSSFENAGFAEL